MQHPEVLKQLGDSRIRIGQFDPPVPLPWGGAVHFKTEPGEHSKKRAVHQHAFREIENEIAIAFLTQLIDQRFEIDTRIEIRPPDNLNTGEFFPH